MGSEADAGAFQGINAILLAADFVERVGKDDQGARGE